MSHAPNTTPPPAQDDPGALRQALVDRLKQAGHLRSASIEGAFRAVPRHVFLPSLTPQQAYRDEAIPIKSLDGRLVSSASQPAIMAIMLEQLEPAPGQRILEIGAGSGYNAALLAFCAGERGRVVTLELEDDLADAARLHLRAAGCGAVQVVAGDGTAGYAPGAPYDRIMLTAGAGDIAQAWWEQLKPDGRLVLPLRVFDELQLCTVFVRDGDSMVSVAIDSCGFVPLRGAALPPEAAEVLPDGKARLLRLLRAVPFPVPWAIKLRNLLAFGNTSPAGLHIRAYPRQAPYTAGDADLVLERRHTRFVFSRIGE